MYAPHLPISEAEVSQWSSLLSVKPYDVGDDIQRIYEYTKNIAGYSNQEKGEDLGRCVLIMGELQGRQTGLGLYESVNIISAEANSRAIAHVLYLRAVHNLDFINGNGDGGVLTSNLIDAAVAIREQYADNPEVLDLGIKMVEYISRQILD